MEGDNKLRDSPPESDIYEVQEIVGMKKVDVSINQIVPFTCMPAFHLQIQSFISFNFKF